MRLLSRPLWPEEIARFKDKFGYEPTSIVVAQDAVGIYVNKNNPLGGHDLTTLRTPFGKRRFEKQGDKLIQNSMVDEKLSWVVAQVKDIIDPMHPSYNEKARLAKTVRFDKAGQMEWGNVPVGAA